MAWNDGLSKELDAFFNNVLGGLEGCAYSAITETVDKYSTSTFNQLKKTTPTSPRTDINLADRLTMKKVTEKGSSYYGYIIRYEGEFKSGNKMVPYQKLANIMNYGSITAQKKKDGSYGDEYENWGAKRFITKAVKKLKAVNPEINDLFVKKQKELMKNG